VAREERAGASAKEHAQRLRAKAARIEEQARRWEQGADGEQITANVLNPLSGDGWHILHDLAIPNSAANIDHVAVGPPGVFVVDSKNWTGRVNAGDGTLWTGRYPKRRELETLRWERDQIASVLSGALPTWPISCRAVICLTSAKLDAPVLEAGDITAVAPAELVRHLAGRPGLLQPGHIDRIAEVLDRRLGSRTGSGSAVVRPDPLPPMPPIHPAPPRRTPVSPSRPVPPPRRTRRSKHSSQSTKRTLVVIGLMVVAMIAAPRLIKGFADSTSRAVIASLPHITTPATPATVAPGVLGVTWTCPKPGSGWTATLSWPQRQVPTSMWESLTASTTAGPWTVRQVGAAGTSPQVTGMIPGSSEMIRAGSIISNSPMATARLVAPAGC